MNPIVRYSIKLFFIISTAVLIQSCSTGKYLSDSQSLLDENKINFVGDVKPNNKALMLYDLQSFYQQVPNSNLFLFIPREYYHFAHSAPADTSWYDNWLRKDLGEPPTIYEEQISNISANSMQQFLRNKKGYYNAHTTFKSQTINKKTLVTYEVDLGDQYKIGEIEYIGQDTNTVELIKSFSNNTFLKKGEPIDAALFDKEKNRITRALQNRGYSRFIPNYINVKGDSSNFNQTIDIFMEIKSPLPELYHKKYNVGQINVFTDYYQGQDLSLNSVDTLNGINFLYQTERQIIRPKTLLRSIYLNTNDIYKQNNQAKTFKKLSEFDMYRFVSINPYYTEESDSLINYNIFITPYENKWVSDFGLNLFYSTISNKGRSLLGLGGTASLTNRNIWRSGNTLTFDLEATDEFQITQPIQQSAVTVNLQTNLKMPKQFDLLGFARSMRFLGLLRGERYETFKDETKTNISLGFNIQNIKNAYDIRSTSISFGYDYTPNISTRYLIRQLGLDLNAYSLDEAFLTIINDNEFIKRSFTDNLFTGFVFRELGYFYQSPKSKQGHSFAFLANTEISGGEVYLANKLYNKIKDTNETWKLSNRYEYSQFAKVELDFRYYHEVSKGSQIASRFNVGMTAPLIAQQEVPYVKQFFVGGPNSIRAWQIRQLGPGSYEDVFVPNIFYQQGDIKLEFNLEYRFDLFWIVELATFVDGGNVWTRKEDTSRPGANFTSQFYDDIALGAGWGIRFDFVYFNIRFDFGYPIRNPYEDENGSHWVQLREFQGLGNVNLAVNYPF